MSNPAIINSWNRVAMRRIRSFPDADRHRLLDAIPRATQNAIVRARSDEWLPAERAIDICDALVEVLGSETAVEFWRDIVYDSWVGGLLEPLGNKLRGEPDEETRREVQQGVLTLAPAAWTMSARDCGKIETVRDADGGLRLEARELPDQIRNSDGIRAMYAGALKAMLSFSGMAASVTIVEDDQQLSFALSFK